MSELGVDLLIIGGGPAGAACAIAARSVGMQRVAIIDASGVKLCGGLLNTEAQAELARLLDFAREPSATCAEACAAALRETGVAVDPLLPTLRVEDWDNRRSFSTQPGYLNMDRERFDAWLLRRAEAAGARVLRDVRGTALERDGGGWRVIVQPIPNGERTAALPHAIRARTLVLATGYHGLARLVPGYRPASAGTYLALQRSVRVSSGGEHAMRAVFASRFTDYFGWVIPKRELHAASTLHIGTAVPASVRAKGEAFLDEMLEALNQQEGGELLPASAPTRGCPIAVPRTVRETQVDVLPGAFAIGEAAGFVSPASGDGISFALQTGRIVGECLARRAQLGGMPRYDSDLAAIERALHPVRRRVARQVMKANVMASPRLRLIGTAALGTRVGRMIAGKLGVAGMK